MTVMDEREKDYGSEERERERCHFSLHYNLKDENFSVLVC